MKLKILVLILTVNSYYSFSQINLWHETKGDFYQKYSSEYDLLVNNLEKDRLKLSHVKSRSITAYSKKSKRVETYSYDLEGRLIQKEHVLKGKTIYSKSYTYNNQGLVSKISVTNSKNKSETTVFKYNGNNQLIESETMDFKGVYHAYKITFNANDKVTSKVLFKKDRNTPVKSLNFSFYEDGSKKSTTYINKGKVKYVWNFECSEEGTLNDVKHKDETKICVKREKDADGNTFEWTRNFDEKGKLTKTKKTYTNDTIWVKTERFNENGKLISEQYIKKDGGYINQYYDKNNISTTSYETFINNDEKIVKSINNNGSKNWSSITLYTYTDDLKNSEVTIFRKRINAKEYHYSYF